MTDDMMITDLILRYLECQHMKVVCTSLLAFTMPTLPFLRTLVGQNLVTFTDVERECNRICSNYELLIRT